MTAPPIADPREDMYLDCQFDMGAEILYAVKWYKDDQEFFRYMPHQKPHDMTYPVPGVHMTPQAASCGEKRCEVRLTNLTREHSGGAYRCEVSSEAPAFRLASETHNVTVAVLPKDSPVIIGLSDNYYQLGDTVAVECSSSAADPTPEIRWFINNQPAPANREDSKISPVSAHGLASRSLSLKFKIESQYLVERNILRLRCDVSLPSIPVEPQTVGRTIIVRTQPSQVINQKLHSTNSSSLTSHPKLNIIFIVLLASVRWRQSY